MLHDHHAEDLYENYWLFYELYYDKGHFLPILKSICSNKMIPRLFPSRKNEYFLLSSIKISRK